MKYWYLPAMDSSGHKYLLGPYISEYECQLKADKIDESTDEPIQYATRDLSKATRLYKEGKVGMEPFDEAVSNIRHTVKEKEGWR